jgi:carboxyl-terminal processing protease
MTGLFLLITIVPICAESLKPAAGAPATAMLVQKLLQDHHFAGKPLTEERAKDWIKAYMESLDYNHAFFLDSDLVAYQNTYAGQLAQLTQQGNTMPAFEIFSGFNERVRDRLAWIKKRLQLPFDFSTDQSYEIDRTKVGWPKDSAMADELWERRLKFDMLREKLAPKSKVAKEKKKPDEDPLVTVTKRYDRLVKNLEEYDSEEILQLYLTSLASLYDPHSTYMSAATLEDFSIGIKLALVGIGAVLASEDGYCVIKELVPGGPADLDGRLKVGDKIIGVAQGENAFDDIVDMKLRNAVKKIRGPKNTIVRLQVIPAGSNAGEQREVQITRDEVKLAAQQATASVYDIPKPPQTKSIPIDVKTKPTEAKAASESWWDKTVGRLSSKDAPPEAPLPKKNIQIPQVEPNSWRVGVIDLPSFYGEVGGADSSASGNGAKPRSTSDDVQVLLKKLNQAQVDGVILDLRKNGGGLLDEAVTMTGLFIDQGPVVQVRDNKGTVIQRTDDAPGSLYQGPLLVLTGRRSASASEIAAGALQNYGRALVVGEKSTHGKGTVQAVVELGRFLKQGSEKAQPQAGAVKLTIQKFYLPNGHSTQNRGVIPDISIPSPLDYMKIGESDLPNALPWDEIGPSRYLSSKMDPSLKSVLEEKSKDRIASDRDMDFLKADIEKVKSRIEAGKISLNETSRIQEKKIEDERNDQRKKIEERLEKVSEPKARLVIDDKKGVILSDKDPKKKKPTLEESADGETEGITDAVDLAEAYELGEALKIMRDWLNFQSAHQGATIAKDRANPSSTIK